MTENINDVLDRYTFLARQGYVVVQNDDYEHVANYVNKARGGEKELLKTALHYGAALGYKAAMEQKKNPAADDLKDI